MRPATLDRVENGGSGSDINPRERKPKETTLDNRALFRPVFIQSAAVLEAVKARPGNGGVRRYGGATAGRDSFCARRRRKSAVGAEESLRRGRTKERAQARKSTESKSARKKCLRSWRRLENEETALGSNKETGQKEKPRRPRRGLTPCDRASTASDPAASTQARSGQMMCYQNRTT